MAFNMDRNSIQTVRRLQLGTSRLEKLEKEVLDVFLDKSWLHLGDANVPENSQEKRSWAYFCRKLKRRSIIEHVVHNLSKPFRRKKKAIESKSDIDDLYSQTNFVEYYYTKGDRLPLEDGSVEFVYSEHFFEHLFLDEALALMRECNRVLKSNGVIRTCVPDEINNFCLGTSTGEVIDEGLPYTDPRKHKIMWTVYSLCEALAICGFQAVPLHFSKKDGVRVQHEPSSMSGKYSECCDKEMVNNLDYVRRKPMSLLVDGIKVSSPASYETWDNQALLP